MAAHLGLELVVVCTHRRVCDLDLGGYGSWGLDGWGEALSGHTGLGEEVLDQLHSFVYRLDAMM